MRLAVFVVSLGCWRCLTLSRMVGCGNIKNGVMRFQDSYGTANRSTFKKIKCASFLIVKHCAMCKITKEWSLNHSIKICFFVFLGEWGGLPTGELQKN